jgi:amidohydrolase
VTAQQSLDAMVDREIVSLLSTYKMLHAAPELSRHEEKTSAFLAGQLRALGFAVTEHVGKYDRPDSQGYGVVAVMKNGDGPTVLVRTDMDALPVEEKTGLPYASKVKTKTDEGQDVSVMHACGHDVHITNLIGAARLLAALKNQWRGTLMLIGQPAEETVEGSRAMLADGLYSRFPKPDFVIAMHDSADVEAGKITYCPGYAMASATSVDLIIRGLGGHGSKPENTKDPIVIASQIVLALQTIVSRENSPLDPAVVTIGSIHGGAKRNIIPDEVMLQLTIRTYKETVRQHILSSIERIARGVAMAAGVPADRAPVMKVIESENAPSLYNDPQLTERLAKAISTAIGADNVVQAPPLMASEDFGRFSLDQKIPSVMFWFGAIEPSRVAASKKSGEPLPSLHSSLFEPLPEPTLRTGIKAMTSAVLELMKK